MSISTWNLHSPCGALFRNLPQGDCGIQMEQPNRIESLRQQWTSLYSLEYIFHQWLLFFAFLLSPLLLLRGSSPTYTHTPSPHQKVKMTILKQSHTNFGYFLYVIGTYAVVTPEEYLGGCHQGSKMGFGGGKGKKFKTLLQTVWFLLFFSSDSDGEG